MYLLLSKKQKQSCKPLLIFCDRWTELYGIILQMVSILLFLATRWGCTIGDLSIQMMAPQIQSRNLSYGISYIILWYNQNQDIFMAGSTEYSSHWENFYEEVYADSLTYIHCDFQFKNDKHVLFDCVFAQKVWDQRLKRKSPLFLYAHGWYSMPVIKLCHDGYYPSAHQIAMQTLRFAEEYKSLHHQSVHSNRVSHPSSVQRMWKAPKLGYLNINTNINFFESKIGIGILVRNFLGMPLLARALPHIERFTVNMMNSLVSLRVLANLL